MIIPIDASYLYFFVVRKQQRQPLVNNINVCDDTEGVSTAVHVMAVVQSERKCALCSRDPGMFYYHASVGGGVGGQHFKSPVNFMNCRENR